MLTHDQLAELYTQARDETVLSVYVDGEQHDPADRHVWRTRLERGIAERRREVEEKARDQLGDFDQARDHLLDELREFSSFIPDRGWVGFVGVDGVIHAGVVPVPMPDLVAWEPGLRAAPYVRALKQDRPVAVALADRHRARLFVYQAGGVDEVAEFSAEDDRVELTDAQSSRRSGERSGTRGNATDEAQRLVEMNAEAMLDRVAQAVADRAGRDGFAVVGGTRETGRRLLQQLESTLLDRAIEVSSLHLNLSPAEVRTEAESAATELTQRLQKALVKDLIDRTRSGGKGVLGDEETAAALLEGRADTLVLSRSFRQEHAERADHMVGTAFDRGASLEEVSGPGAELLDDEGHGVGAILRW